MSEHIIIRATIQVDFAFLSRHANGWSAEEILHHWFENYPAGKRHAGRDAGRIYMSEKYLDLGILNRLDYELGGG